MQKKCIIIHPLTHVNTQVIQFDAPRIHSFEDVVNAFDKTKKVDYLDRHDSEVWRPGSQEQYGNSP